MARPGASAIDGLMDQASRLLVATDYFAAQRAALDALRQARSIRDHERMARICMPLLEARRLIRQQACDAGPVRVVASAEELSSRPVAPGCVLIQPPLVGIRARELRAAATEDRVPLSVLAREPRPRTGPNAGLWPIVAVGERDPESLIRAGPTPLITLRVYRPPPPGVVPDDASPTRDRITAPIGVDWFMAAQEALGDAALRAMPAGEPAAVRVDDILDLLDALPDHEKLWQALAQACRDAASQPPVTRPWRRASP